MTHNVPDKSVRFPFLSITILILISYPLAGCINSVFVFVYSSYLHPEMLSNNLFIIIHVYIIGYVTITALPMLGLPYTDIDRTVQVNLYPLIVPIAAFLIAWRLSFYFRKLRE